MVYTVTFNPSIDYIAGVMEFQAGRVNRTCEEKVFPGGKGINVSLVLKNLGMESTALGFTAGFTGAEIRRLVRQNGILEQFIEVEEGISRINVKLRSLSDTGDGVRRVAEESEINGMGPTIDAGSLSLFYSRLDALAEGDVLVLAGSIPSTLSADSYRDIMVRLSGRGIRIVVDATRELLLNVLEYRPFLVKPNHFELGELFGVSLNGKKEVAEYAKKLQEMGAENVLVSMAGEGAVLAASDGSLYETDAPKGRVVNSVGAGDSMVAGFLYGYLTEHSYEKAFYYGVCAGSASAFSENLATKEEVEGLLKTI